MAEAGDPAVTSMMTVSEQREAIAAGSLSSVELVESYLGRIEALNPQLNALVTVDADGARRAAAEADSARTDGEPVGPLHGIPFTVKDAIATAGMRTTAGARELRDHIPTTDAPAVSQLRDAGAILLGKANLPRWSGNIQTSNDIFGTTVNPWDATRTPGGSSGGSAAAVASGLTSFDIGSDLGGSIRIPAHFCGVAGHRPSHGLVPQRGYIDHVDGGTTETDINVLGPIARSVADLRLLLGVLASPEPRMAPAWRVSLPQPRHADERDYRIGVWLDDTDTVLDSEVRRILEAAVDQLSDRGLSVTIVRPDVDFALSRSLCSELIAAAILPSMDVGDSPHPADRHSRWLRNRELLDGVRDSWGAWFSRYDALVCPVMSVPAFPHDPSGTIGEMTLRVGKHELTHRDLAHMWNAPSGVAGLPSTVVPVGRTAEGLPVGAQVIGPYLEDLTALAVAEILESASAGFVPPPAMG